MITVFGGLYCGSPLMETAIQRCRDDVKEAGNDYLRCKALVFLLLD